MITLEIIAKISLFVVVGMLALWQLRRKPYRSGYPIRMTPRSQVEPLPEPRITIQHVTPGAADGVEVIDGHFVN